MKKTLIISLGLIVAFLATGCTQENETLKTAPKTKIKIEDKKEKPVMTFKKELPTKKNAVSAAQNAKKLAEKQINSVENLLK